MQRSHQLAEEKYTNLRQIAYELTMEELPYQDSESIRLAEICTNATAAFNASPEYHQRMVNWDWKFGVKSYRNRYPNRFELAIWFEKTLCGLSIGRPTYHGSGVRLDFIERNPVRNNPLVGRITPIAVTAYEVYARLIDAKQLRIMFPEKELINYYSSLDFVYVPGTGTSQNPSYLYKNLVGNPAW